MSHNLETMFAVGDRRNLWHGLGKCVSEALTSGEALIAAGLDWKVEARDVFLQGSAEPVSGYKANIRVGARKIDLETGEAEIDSDGLPVYRDENALAIMSDKYQIVQNTEAFAFVDELIGAADAHYDTAGSLRDGKVVWLLAKMPAVDVMGDEVDPYICFSNSHDGSSGVRVCMTPVRVVCNNTLNLAMSGANRSWTGKHTGNISDKLEEARITLRLADRYMERFAERAEFYSKQKIDDRQYQEIIEQIFPMPDGDPEAKENRRRANNTRFFWSACLFCYNQPDIARFRGTKWGVLNAISDTVYHGEPLRKTDNYRENLWGKSMGGNPILDKAVAVLDKAAV